MAAVSPPDYAFTIQSFSVDDLKPDILQGCCELWSIAFAKPGRDKDSVMAERLMEIQEEDEEKKRFTRDERWHVVSETLDDGSIHVIAAARSFSRIMLFADGVQRHVCGLAHVASHPEKRGCGLGKKVVQEALNRLQGEEETIFCFLFQSSSPEFYTKLGARHLSNDSFSIINSTGEGSDAKRVKGFWDPCVLVYPDVELPPGTIDLLGPGY